MVIQEAHSAGRPVIGSAIGGIAEKVAHGTSGLQTAVGNARDVAMTLATASRYKSEWDQLRSKIQPPISHSECAAAHISLLQSEEADR